MEAVTKMSGCISSDNYDKDEEVILPGFRFHPTDEELVGFYLRRKVEKKRIGIELIKQIDIYKYDPWDLPISTAEDKEWYFFCLRGRKYRNSVRPNRVTRSGFWKATGIDKPIYSDKETHECIGLKKCLVYYRGSAGKGTKTDWMMHEFRLPPNGKTTNPLNAKNIPQDEAEVWTLCRILKRIPSYKKYVAAVPATEQKPINCDSNSKSCSFESETSTEQDVSFGDSFVQRNERKPVTIDQVDHERNHLFMGGHEYDSVTEAPFTAAYQGFRNTGIGDDFFVNGNWDDLRTVVELAIDPAQVPDECRIW